MLSKKDMADELRKGVCCVTFNKVNGDQRVMNCTLHGGMVPSEEALRLANLKSPRKVVVPTVTGGLLDTIVEMKESRKVNPSVLNVYATDNHAWRSFKVDNVTSFVNCIGEELCPS